MVKDESTQVNLPPMTASRALNNRGYVSAVKRTAVLAAATKLDYTVNQAARALAGGAPFKIALLYSNPSASFFSEFLLGSLEEAGLHHAQLVTRCGAPRSARRIALELRDTGVSGVVLPPPRFLLRIVVISKCRAMSPSAVSMTANLPARLGLN